MSSTTPFADIPVSWSGQDDTGGSGIATYNIYVSTDGGPFTLWLANTTGTTGLYPGAFGHRYGFYSQAVDNVGNVEATHTTPDTQTIVPAAVQSRLIFYNNSSFDGGNAAANAPDDNAIATDKSALSPGQKATFANYTSYPKGINGIIVDIAGLPANGTPAA